MGGGVPADGGKGPYKVSWRTVCPANHSGGSASGIITLVSSTMIELFSRGLGINIEAVNE